MKPLFLVLLFIFTTNCGNYQNIKKNLNQPTNDQTLTIDKSKIDFAFIRTNILNPHCISCHKGTHKIYENYTVVSNSKDLILERIKSFDPSKKMPPQKDGLNALSPELINLFEIWIDLGTPEFSTSLPKKTEEDKTFISFKEIKEKILKPNNCISCHSQYNDYSTVQASLGSIASQITNNKMPFPRRKNMDPVPVSDEAKELLLTWVSQGAPEYSDHPSSPIKAIQLEPTWISLRNNVFGAKCVLCHNSYGPRGPKSMATYREIRDWFMKNPDLFNFEKPELSYFIGAILGTNPDSFGLVMPLNTDADDIKKEIPLLTTDELSTIKKWIELKLPFGEDDL